MEVHDPFDDLVLGHVTFDTKAKEWLFNVTIADREIQGRIVPEDESVPLEAQGLEGIRWPMGEAAAGLPGAIHRMDQRGLDEAPHVSRSARGQTRS